MHCLNLSANKKMENGETESLSSEDDSVVVSLLEQKKKKYWVHLILKNKTKDDFTC